MRLQKGSKVVMGVLSALALVLVYLRLRPRSFKIKNVKGADWANTIYFKPHEFDSPDDSGSGRYMDHQFIRMLDNARSISRFPFIVNSGFRTKIHNENVGGQTDSSHLLGYAADIHAVSLSDLRVMVKAAEQAGFKRIGAYKTKSGGYFMHVDNDAQKLSGKWYYINYSRGKGDKVSFEKFFS